MTPYYPKPLRGGRLVISRAGAGADIVGETPRDPRRLDYVEATVSRATS